MRRLRIAARTFAGVSLTGLSALHCAWALGSAWPATDRATLADAVGGFERMPGTRACILVAALLAAGASSIARDTRIGSTITALAFLARGGAGLLRIMPHARRSARFASLDRRLYSPLCCAIAAATLFGARS